MAELGFHVKMTESASLKRLRVGPQRGGGERGGWGRLSFAKCRAKKRRLFSICPGIARSLHFCATPAFYLAFARRFLRRAGSFCVPFLPLFLRFSLLAYCLPVSRLDLPRGCWICWICWICWGCWRLSQYAGCWGCQGCWGCWGCWCLALLLCTDSSCFLACPRILLSCEQ